MGSFLVGHTKDGEHVYQTVLPTWILLFFPSCKCSKCVVRHLGKAPPSPRNVFKFPLKIDKYLWHGFICCWPHEGRRACVSNTVTNLSIVFLFNLFLFCKCSKCVVRHLGKAPTSPRNVFKFRLKLIRTCDMGSFVVGHTKDGEYVYQTVLPTWILLFFSFCKCSKCVVRHLGKAPPSPRNVFKFPLKIDKYLWHGFICCWPLEGRRACVSNSATNLNIVFFPFCKCSKCVVRHLGRPPTSPRHVSFSFWIL